MENLFSWVRTLAVFGAFATSVNATEVTIEDTYLGGSTDVNGSASIYDIEKMVVERDGSNMSVRIYTNFAGESNQHYTNNRSRRWGDPRIVYGDLFMGVADENTGDYDWDYAYELDYASRHNNNGGWGRLGGITNSTSVYESDDWHRTGARNNQIVSAYNTSWIDNWSRWYVTDSYLQFTFDVAGTALETASQIAFRWTMTCANDIIQGVANLTDRPTQVPAPMTLSLLLLGMGLLARRKYSQ